MMTDYSLGLFARESRPRP